MSRKTVRALNKIAGELDDISSPKTVQSIGSATTHLKNALHGLKDLVILHREKDPHGDEIPELLQRLVQALNVSRKITKNLKGVSRG